MIAESIALHRVFDDSDARKALAEFFEAQAAIEKVTAAELMAEDRPNIELARKHACYASAYEEAVNRLSAHLKV